MSGGLRLSRGWRLAAAGVLAIGLTACGGSSTTTTPSSSTSTPAGPASSDAVSDTPSPTSASADDSEWLALDMKVRVVNLWHPGDSATGQAIDVYAETAQDGKKLMTVAPGTASELVVPVMKKLFAGEGEKTFNLSFYPEGKTVRDDELIYQGETSASGLVLTYVLLPPSPDGDGGSSIQVFADETGSSTDWSSMLVGTPPAGKAALMLNATALQYAGKEPTDYPTYLASTTAGKCIGYLDGDGTEHTDTSTFSLIGGTSGMTVVLDPGEQFRINKTGSTSEGVDKVCASKPVVPATDPGLSAGGRAYGFLWGPDPSAPDLLLVPIG